jgi:hypothetical protein
MAVTGGGVTALGWMAHRQLHGAHDGGDDDEDGRHHREHAHGQALWIIPCQVSPLPVWDLIKPATYAFNLTNLDI